MREKEDILVIGLNKTKQKAEEILLEGFWNISETPRKLSNTPRDRQDTGDLNPGRGDVENCQQWFPTHYTNAPHLSQLFFLSVFFSVILNTLNFKYFQLKIFFTILKLNL